MKESEKGGRIKIEGCCKSQTNSLKVSAVSHAAGNQAGSREREQIHLAENW